MELACALLVSIFVLLRATVAFSRLFGDPGARISWRTSLVPDEPSLKDKMTLYEDGKHRRYSLLFSVNGGAFAVAKILAGTEGKHAEVLGQLRLSDLSWGMILFTAIMAADIYAFGYKMRKALLPEAFDWRGKLVLISLGLLICIGWYLVGRPGAP